MNDLRVSFPKPCSEQWDDMLPDGCNRHCERCEKTIYDLSELTLEEVEELARSSEFCVRAEVGTAGEVRLSEGRGARRMVATIGAAVGIVTATPAFAGEQDKLGAITGKVEGACGGEVIATATDGRAYRAKVGFNSRYKVKRLPAGSYLVSTDPVTPGVSAAAASVLVEAGRTAKLNLPNPGTCIIIGMLKVDNHHG